jgi:hypothetical protein
MLTKALYRFFSFRVQSNVALLSSLHLLVRKLKLRKIRELARSLSTSLTRGAKNLENRLGLLNKKGTVSEV